MKDCLLRCFIRKQLVLSTILRHTGSHCRTVEMKMMAIDMKNAEVFYVTLFTPGPSNTALLDGYVVKIVECCGMGSGSE